MERDYEGDVIMQVPQPVYMPVLAPRLTGWDQATLITWVKKRRQYEEELRSRCRVTGESYESLLTPIKSSMDPRVLGQVARLVLKKPLDAISDEEIGRAIQQRSEALQNSHIPDLDKLFKDKLKMDLRENDTEARILKYYMLFDQIVEEHGLESLLGAGREAEASYKQRMSLRCKYLLAHVAPEMLKIEVERMAIATPALKEDEIALYEKLVERAREQQHYHLLSMELKGTDRSRTKTNDKDINSQSNTKKGSSNSSRTGEQQPRSGAPGRREKPDVEKPSRKPPRDGCLLCGGPHWVADCDAPESEKEEALKRAKEKKEQRLKAKKAKSLVAQGEKAAIINGVLEVPYRADTGADLNVISRRIVQELQELDCDVVTKKRDTAISVEVADGRLMLCDDECELDVQVVTAAGPVNLRKLKCIIMDGDSEEFLLGDATLKSLGINVDQLLEQLAAKIEPGADDDDIPDDDIVGIATDDEVLERVNAMLDEVAAHGFPAEFLDAAKTATMAALDSWRVKLGADPPAKLEPLRVVLKPDAVPYRTKPRTYSPTQNKFLSEYGKMLERCKYVVRNNQSRWACAAIATRKKGPVEEYRITPDYRPANAQSVPIAGVMPNLLVVMLKIKGARFFAKFDLFKGFWQLLLHEDSREIFSFMTNDSVYTPLRVPQGATDSPIHFQNQMQEVFRDMLYENLLVWVDDIVLFAKTAEEFVSVLQKFYARVQEYGLKLNANKSCLFSREVSWCGRLIDGTGVRHDPERVQSLLQLPLPATAADLQKFLCAANWLRETIVDYAQHAAPLQAKLDAAFAGRSRKQRYAEGIAIEWTGEEEQQYRAFLDCLAASTKLAFPDDDATVCVCTDASDRGWSLIVSQVAKWDDDKQLSDQAHELVMCKGGMFKGAQLHWSIAEKEGYPIVKAAKDLEYLLLRPHGFKLFCDHANLIQIFCPSTEVRKHVRGKLQRWSLILADYRYDIEHVKGTDNVWADLVSRWLAPTPQPVAVKAVRTRSEAAISRLRPLQDAEFVWPNAQDVRDAQQRFRRHAPDNAADSEEGLLLTEGKVWIPTQARELLTRILIVAHCGLNAHRGADVMMTQLQDKYSIKKLGDLVKTFISECLLCKHVKGGLVIQRPWSEPREPAARNEVLHFDFLFMGDSYGTTRYVLVLKDELTHFCELIACDSPTSAVTAAAVLDWAKRFGMPKEWMSDNGSHFKNALMDDLRERMRSLHTFIPVYTPWVNGTVERLNRDLLQVMRVLLLEYQLDTKSWEYLLPLVQSNLNQTPVRSLGNKAPVELFTGLKTSTPLDTLILPPKTGTKARLMQIDVSKADEELELLRESLEEMHKEVVDRKEKTRLYQIAAKKGTLENFSVGDYVLWSRVDERLRGNKLLVRWVGPYRVVEAREYSYLIQHLITNHTTEVHGSRLKFYHDASLDVDEEIVQHVGKQGIVLGVAEIKEHRYNDATRQWELLIAWRGLQDVEDSWEPLNALQRDIPVLIDEYIAAHEATDLREHLNQA